jgi:hypothetical protein
LNDNNGVRWRRSKIRHLYSWLEQRMHGAYSERSVFNIVTKLKQTGNPESGVTVRVARAKRGRDIRSRFSGFLLGAGTI